MYVLYVYTVYKIGQTNCQLSCFKYCTVNQGLNGGKNTPPPPTKNVPTQQSYIVDMLKPIEQLIASRRADIVVVVALAASSTTHCRDVDKAGEEEEETHQGDDGDDDDGQVQTGGRRRSRIGRRSPVGVGQRSAVGIRWRRRTVGRSFGHAVTVCQDRGTTAEEEEEGGLRQQLQQHCVRAVGNQLNHMVNRRVG